MPVRRGIPYKRGIYFITFTNPCTGKWKLAADAMKYEHSSARFYISGKRAAYEVKNVEDIIRESINRNAESTARTQNRR